MSDDVADRAEAALEGTSPEPWHIPRSGQGIDSGEYGTVIERGNVECMSYCYGGTSTIEGDNLDADLRFIAAARSLVPELVDALKTARAELDRLRAQLPGPIGPTPLCPAGCDCSCCYGYDDRSCHHYAQPCNCGRTHA